MSKSGGDNGSKIFNPNLLIFSSIDNYLYIYKLNLKEKILKK